MINKFLILFFLTLIFSNSYDLAKSALESKRYNDALDIMFDSNIFGEASRRISLERCLVGEELSIPVYHYEAAAKEEKRKNLANCREGEREDFSLLSWGS